MVTKENKPVHPRRHPRKRRGLTRTVSRIRFDELAKENDVLHARVRGLSQISIALLALLDGNKEE